MAAAQAIACGEHLDVTRIIYPHKSMIGGNPEHLVILDNTADVRQAGIDLIMVESINVTFIVTKTRRGSEPHYAFAVTEAAVDIVSRNTGFLV